MKVLFISILLWLHVIESHMLFQRPRTIFKLQRSGDIDSTVLGNYTMLLHNNTKNNKNIFTVLKQQN